ncbi:MAG: bifunctional riboflavin kinase/FAD synthetase [Brevefilum sp.]
MLKNNKQEQLHVIDFFELPSQPFSDSCVTIGNFDGVHLGHQAIIKKMVEDSKIETKPVIVITFFPDPSDFFNPAKEAFYLTTPSEKRWRVCQLGVDRVLTLHFTKRLSELTAREFLTALVEKVDLKTLVIGRDFALGRDRQGTLPVIQTLGDELGFVVEVIEPVKKAGEEISSTRIRQHLVQGQVEAAAKLLGRPYSIFGPVTHGSDRGSRIGLPTANIAHWPKKQLPAVGVYATRVFLGKNEYLGITNVGFRPTFEDQESPNIETHILDFDGNIYGEDLELHFIAKIRDEQKFSGVDALLEQIERDKSTARKIFNHEQT